jgi:hypothetical protein
MGDEITSGFGLADLLGPPSLTEWAREQLGSNDVVDPCPGMYKAGGYAGDLWGSAMTGALSGPKGPLLGRGRYRNGNPGLFNRGNNRFGWSWNKEKGRNMLGFHGGTPGTPGHWHKTPIPGPRGPLW